MLCPLGQTPSAMRAWRRQGYFVIVLPIGGEDSTGALPDLYDTSGGEFDAIRRILPNQGNLWIGTTTSDEVKSWRVINSGTKLAIVPVSVPESVRTCCNPRGIKRANRTCVCVTSMIDFLSGSRHSRLGIAQLER